MENIIICCPKCRAELEIERDWVGATIECPACNNQFTAVVPDTATQVQPIPAVAQVQPAPVPQVQPAPVPQVQPAPAVAQVQPAPVPQVQPAPVAQVQPAPVAQVQPAPLPQVQPAPVAQVQPQVPPPQPQFAQAQVPPPQPQFAQYNAGTPGAQYPGMSFMLQPGEQLLVKANGQSSSTPCTIYMTQDRLVICNKVNTAFWITLIILGILFFLLIAVIISIVVNCCVQGSTITRSFNRNEIVGCRKNWLGTLYIRLVDGREISITGINGRDRSILLNYLNYRG